MRDAITGKMEQLIEICGKFSDIREENENLTKQLEMMRRTTPKKDLEIIRLKTTNVNRNH